MTSRTTSRSRPGGDHGRAVKLRIHPPPFANQPEPAACPTSIEVWDEASGAALSALVRFEPCLDRIDRIPPVHRVVADPAADQNACASTRKPKRPCWRNLSGHQPTACFSEAHAPSPVLTQAHPHDSACDSQTSTARAHTIGRVRSAHRRKCANVTTTILTSAIRDRIPNGPLPGDGLCCWSYPARN